MNPSSSKIISKHFSHISFEEMTVTKTIFLSSIAFFGLFIHSAFAQSSGPIIQYEVSIMEPATHTYNVELHSGPWQQDTLILKMPQWMPGYYQIMDYAKTVDNISATDEKGRNLPLKSINQNTWLIPNIKNKSCIVTYRVTTARQFVANSYVDSTHAYLIPENTFLYPQGHLNLPVKVNLRFTPQWHNVATGLQSQDGANQFMTANFDLLYDCPILIGNLEELPAFEVRGIEHRFIGYNPGNFDHVLFISNLKKVVESAVAIIGDIPYDNYTFIGIGPGRGGIEHLNNTTFSFDGSRLDSPEAINRIMNFLAHEYFHHYNVKRIRPFELGPFDYDTGSRTNLLWVSEGLSVYYEYLIVKRAAIVDEKTLFTNFEKNINAHENNPGKAYQSLQQASYNTWSDGPFGTIGNEPGKSISYYDKGPIVGLLLDFQIRQATQNNKSLDDVMRLLYWKYYKQESRGFTEAELQQACEQIAGVSLADLFEYVYTTKALDYTKYLAFAGLKIESQMVDNKGQEKQVYHISRTENPDALQTAILRSWLGE